MHTEKIICAQLWCQLQKCDDMNGREHKSVEQATTVLVDKLTHEAFSKQLTLQSTIFYSASRIRDTPLRS